MSLARITYCTLVALLFGGDALGQNVERKVIVENGRYYYITVDDNFQIGTLYTGSTDRKLSESKAFALPAGRGLSAETNPLAWDLAGDQMVAVNFLDHSLNDRNEAIKNIALGDLRQWGVGVEVGDMIMQSVDQEMLALNRPYLFVKERSKYLQHFYFDGILDGDDYWMIMTNNDELTVWQFSEGEWTHSEVAAFPVTSFFHLFLYQKKQWMITSDGKLLEFGLNGVRETQMVTAGFNLANVTLIEDRDNDEVYYIENSQFNRDKSMRELIEGMAIKLIQ